MINSVTSYKSYSNPVAVGLPVIKILKYTFVKTLLKPFFIYYAFACQLKIKPIV